MQPPSQQPNPSGGQQQQQQQPYDMQRFQQQLQAQYRQQMLQQQQQPGGFNFPPGAFNPQLMMQTMQQQLAQQQGNNNSNNSSATNAFQSILQQQQQQHQPNAAGGLGSLNPQQPHQQHQSLPNFIAQQQQQSHNNNTNGNGSVGSGGMLSQQTNAFAAAQWGNLHQQQQPGGAAPAADASSESSARLMATMAGAAFGLQQQQQQPGGSNSLNNTGTSTNSALQNMKAVLLQQQQQRAAQQQQQQPPNGLGGSNSAFASANNLAQVGGGGGDGNNSNSASSSNNNTGSNNVNPLGVSVSSGAPGMSGNSAQQQMIFQQQLAALQQQKQQLMNSAGGGSEAAAAALAAMQNSFQQQQHGNNNNNNNNALNQLPQQQQQPPGSASSNSLSQQTTLLQARQQQLLQQMQQMQQRQINAQQQQQQSGSSATNAAPSSNNMRVQLRQGSGSAAPGLAQQMASHINPMMQLPQMQQQRSESTNQQQQPSHDSGNGNNDDMSNNNNQGASGSQHGSMLSGMVGRAGSAMSSGEQQQPQHSSSGLHHNMHSAHSSSGDLQQQQQEPQQPPQQQQQQQYAQVSANNSVVSGAAESTSEQRTFLDGRFAGGWQSNADLPDRRQVIYNILEVIKQMRPDTTRLSSKLPHMAKSLEEHLYRSAKSKEDYMNLSTLKKRLQAIAHGLEIHRSSDSVGTNSESGSIHGSSNAPGQMVGQHLQQQGDNESGSNSNWSASSAHVGSGAMGSAQNLSNLAAQLGSAGNMAAQLTSMQQQRHQVHTMAHLQHGMNSNVDSMGGQVGSSNAISHPSQMHQWSGGLDSSIPSVVALQPQSQASGGGDASQSMNYNATQPQREQPERRQSTLSQSGGDSSSTGKDQKRRVILQQQQRLLLLRHASKCKIGPSCTTKFCDQMVTLWRHMKACRDKNCTTSHCLSSRCVLNHYRICKSNGRTMSCEVCGPVMIKIKQQEHDDGSVDDPLARDHDFLPPAAAPQPQIPSVVATSQPQQQRQQKQQMGSSDQAELIQLQAQQAKLEAQLASLKLLERRQEELLRQQKSLEEQAQAIKDPTSSQAGQFQEKYALLRQLQKRCQQQQLLVQQELQMQTPAINAVNAMAQSNPKQLPSSSTGAPAATAGAAPANNSGPVVHAGLRAQRRGSGIGHKHLGKTLALHQAGGKKKRNSASTKAGDLLSKRLKAAKAAPAGKKPATKKTEELAISPLLCMSKEQIQKHLESLNKRIVLSSRTVTHKCRPIINELLEHQFGWVFKDAVDPVALGLPDYFDVIKNPMHLELVKKKVENAIYSDMDSFARDARLVFQNAILYNGESSEVGELAQSMLNLFEDSFKAVVKDIETSHLHLESQGELCSLCGEQKRRFEPTVLYCQGKCGMERIKRNASYYTDRTKQNHWCEACFVDLKSNEPIHLDDGSEVKKTDLQVFKNDALPEEGWVNCDDCQSWVHQICALFNGRTNKSTARFTCPSCFANKPDTEEVRKASKAVKGAEDLVRCKMSDAIEEGMKSALETAYRERANELGVTVDQVEKAEGLSVRVIANVDKKHMVGDLMIQKYAAENCPSEYPVRTKCIALFQKIHGVDTFLFAMYVYEYGHECPAPNKRRVYISYLDSVQYFEPKCYRTAVYHSVVIEYLRYVKSRGFHTAHIWSCPPTPGDDYIFYCHPKHQLVPREDMLRAWYHGMLDRAKALGVVIRTTTLYDEYFSDDEADPVPCQRRYPTCLPYFEGDYIPGEIENIIQQMGGGTLKPTEDISTQPRDEVMRRIGYNLRKMKDNFIVVHLRNRRFAAAVERGEDVSNWKEDSDDEIVRSKRAKITGKSPAEPLSPSSKKATVGTKTAITVNGSEISELKPGDDSSGVFAASAENGPSTKSSELNQPDPTVQQAETEKSADASTTENRETDAKVNSDTEVGRESTDNENPTSSLDAPTTQTNASSKNAGDELGSMISRVLGKEKRSLFPVADTTDEDPPLESGMFESRQQFLNYCQTTHCQFDELRRAKHSTVMVLFQLHNPMAPKFLQQCGSCYRDITHGTRYHCNQCSNFDLCEECYEPVTTGLWAKRDARFAHDKKHKFTAIDMEAAEKSQKSRAERQKSLKAHVELLEHAGACPGAPDCSSQNCERLKKLFQHVSSCTVNPRKDCKVCTRLLALCTIHARMCTSRGACPIPFCDRIRERNKRLQRQQQLMDDRRRQAQNELYHAGGAS